MYGVHETNPLTERQRELQQAAGRQVDWTTPGLKITRLRLLSDPGFPFWDVSYCYGILNGEPVSVSLPFSQLRKRYTHVRDPISRNLRKLDKSTAPTLAEQIIMYAKRDGLYAKGLGILDCISTLN
jgi:hypothetical protein